MYAIQIQLVYESIREGISPGNAMTCGVKVSCALNARRENMISSQLQRHFVRFLPYPAPTYLLVARIPMTGPGRINQVDPLEKPRRVI